MGMLPDDRYDFDARLPAEGGGGAGVLLAQRLSLRLVEADGLTGSLVAEVVGEIEPSSFESLRPESRSRAKARRKIDQKEDKARRKTGAADGSLHCVRKHGAHKTCCLWQRRPNRYGWIVF